MRSPRSASRSSCAARRDDAAFAFARVLRFDAEHVAALYFDGVLLAEGHRYAEAVARWAQVLDLEPVGRLRAARAARHAHRARTCSASSPTARRGELA